MRRGHHFFLSSRAIRIFTAALCALTLVFACGLKDPLHLLAHTLLGTSCESYDRSAIQDEVTATPQQETCLLNAVLESVSHLSSIAAPASQIQLLTLTEDSGFTFEVASATFKVSAWHAPRGPPAV